MELPCRPDGDRLLPSGEMTDIRRRLRRAAGRCDLTTVIACAFDHRTRMLPFMFADTRMAPAGVRAIGSAMVDSGFERTRIVLQQWNRNFRPSSMRLDGKVPDLFMVSSMGLHSDRCMEMIADAGKIDAEHRPLIIVGGAKTMYQPWDMFVADPDQPPGADVAITGEEYVLLNLLEVLLDIRAEGEPMRSAFMRARDSGALDEVPGLVYGLTDSRGAVRELVDTGIQRLVGDLDELPDPMSGYGLLEPPDRGPGLGSRPLSGRAVGKHTPLGSLVLTLGCKFSCPYCPIPAYNQRQYRTKSGTRIAEEMYRLNERYGIRHFFGTDDNFFNDKRRALDIIETLAAAEFGGSRLHTRIRWSTEVTVHDTLQMAEHLRLTRKSGCRGLWIGVEDMTGTLVKKGQTGDKTIRAFGMLRDVGICPMPMMMHHDAQPLYTYRGDYGLLNQVRLLRKAGAVGLQVLMITPSAGSKSYEQTFTSGLVLQRVGSREVAPHMYDGNYVIASEDRRPWRKQLNLLTAYLYFYNPWSFLKTIIGRKTGLRLKPAGMQVVGMAGLMQTIRRTLGWAIRLMFCKIQRLSGPLVSSIPMRSPSGARAAHAIPGTPGPDVECAQAAPEQPVVSSRV